jgi:hypothetical protein
VQSLFFHCNEKMRRSVLKNQSISVGNSVLPE